MTLSAWRPLKDAPRDRPVVVRTIYGSGPFVAEPASDGIGWLIHRHDGKMSPFAAYEYCDPSGSWQLDRAVQGEIARAFGELIGRLADEYDCANFRHWGALAAFRDILHTAMGGRIPDEVP